MLKSLILLPLAAAFVGVPHGGRHSTSLLAASSKPAPPITLLSGFLGAGKTSTLQHLLKTTNQRIGILVNDVADVNIDSRLLKHGEIIELQNGCACCSIAGEFERALSRMKQHDVDWIVIELSGVADPSAVRGSLDASGEHTIHNVVTILDGSSFGVDYMTWDVVDQRIKTNDACAANRKLSELLAEQIEAADTIVINKLDAMDANRVAVAKAISRSLNSKAEIATAEQGAVDETLLQLQRKEKRKADKKDGIRKTDIDTLGISSFVYKATRPFHVKRLMKVLEKFPVPLKDELDLGFIQSPYEQAYQVQDDILEDSSPFIGVIRCKGFSWFAAKDASEAYRHDAAMYWSHAGRQFGITDAGKFWASLPKSRMYEYFPDKREFEKILRRDFKTKEFGDRRQEIVFIGIGLHEDEITATLNSCLLTNREMERYRQQLELWADKRPTSSLM